MMNKEISNAFKSPRKLTLDRLSFCHATVDDLRHWTVALSVMPLGDAAQAILKAVLEISELKCEETLRFDLIQVLQPNIENVLHSLEKFFFDKNLIHTDRNEQIIELGNCLRGLTIAVYADIARRSNQQIAQKKLPLFAIKQKNNLKIARQLATYYALQQMCILLYKQQTLYSDSINYQWVLAHTLYDIANKNNEIFLNINQIQGTHLPVNNIAQIYAQLLLLDIFNTNQIRPTEIRALYYCSQDWAKMIQILPKETSLSRYFVNKKLDHAVIYNQKHNQGMDAHLFIETQGLLEHINKTIVQEEDNITKTERQYLTSALKFHVQNILSSSNERRHERYEYSAQLRICFSIFAAHYYLSNRIGFSETIMNAQSFTLHSASNTQNTIEQSPLTPTPAKLLDQDSKQIYITEVLDISVNGYRIHWTGETPRNLRTGEFILVSENNNRKWKGAIIRWIKQASNKSLELGLEVLGQDTFACAVRLQADLQNLNYQPALLIQNHQLEYNKISLIIPNLSLFKEKQNIQLRLGKHEFQIQLTKAVIITQSFIQFDFELLNNTQHYLIEDFILDQSDHFSLGET